MNAGRMKHQVIIKKPVTTMDEHADQSDSWTGSPKYHLYAEDKTGGGTDIAKYHAATDATVTTWAYDGTTMRPETTGWDSQDVSSPVVWIEDSVWYMLFEGRATGNQGAIGLATSTDGKTWTKSDSNPVAWGTEYVAAESADDCCTWADHIVPDDIYKEAGTYWMLFHGYDTDAANWYMGVLTSTNLTTWTEPWARPIWSALHGYYAGTLQYANTDVLGMYYQSDDLYDVYPTDADGGRAETMADWNGVVIGQDTENPFLERGTWDATIREPGNMLYDADQTNTRKLWYSGYAGSYAQDTVYVGYAYSTDGATWTKSGTAPVIARSLEDPFVCVDPAGTAEGSTVATVWAQIKPTRVWEQITAQRLGVEATHTVTIRYRSDVDETMRLTWGTRTLNITGVRNLNEANQWLELSCVERR